MIADDPTFSETLKIPIETDQKGRLVPPNESFRKEMKKLRKEKRGE